PQGNVRCLLRRVRTQCGRVRGRRLRGRERRGLGQGEDGMPVLAGVTPELLRAQLPGAPTAVERVLEDVPRGAGLVQHGENVHEISPSLSCLVEAYGGTCPPGADFHGCGDVILAW